MSFSTGKSNCELCSDTGFVIVPHFKFVEGGEWKPNGASRPTMAVNCNCHIGCRITDAQASMDRDRRGVTLAMYEDRIGREYWRSLVDADEQERRQLVAEKNSKKAKSEIAREKRILASAAPQQATA